MCTIHPYRLTVCGSYHCCSARISKDGVEVGKIKGKFSLVSKDDVLVTLWHEKIMNNTADIPHDKIAAVLAENGYTILFYDGE
ncbi:MAG TPA: hypothetical protein O0X27_00410 [Methanocorpusculum sp.]|nr:hypothetical protein [Methanocorpusculum sp.]